MSGCGNCSDNRFGIYSYDFTTGEERPLVESGLNNGPRSIHGQYVVWQGYREDSGSDINVLDLGDRHKRTVAKVDRAYVGPLVSGNFMVWTFREDCDFPGGLPENVPTGAFALNLKTDEVRQISNYVEPQALLHENAALTHENCFGTIRVYAVFLVSLTVLIRRRGAVGSQRRLPTNVLPATRSCSPELDSLGAGTFVRDRASI